MDEEENITRRATRIKSLKDIYDNREDEEERYYYQSYGNV
jgi:hypothetical protein